MLSIDSTAYLIANLIKEREGVTLIITPDSLSAYKLEENLAFFLQSETMPYPILPFPDWETLPYDRFSPHQDIISDRLSTLYRLSTLKQGLIIVAASTLMHRLCPKEFIFQHTLILNNQEKIDLTEMRRNLSESAYIPVTQVMEHGEFAVRGSIIDLFPMGSPLPYRIDLFDDQIDSIRSFEVETQRTLHKVDHLKLLPAREFPFTSDSIKQFRTQWRNHFEGDPSLCQLYLDVTEGHISQGLEYYLPLFFEKTQNLLDYLPENSHMIKLEGVNEAIEKFWQQVKERFDQYGHDRLRPLLAPKELFTPPQEMLAQLKTLPNLNYQKDADQIKPLPELGIAFRQANPLQKLEQWLSETEIGAETRKVLFTAESLGRKETFKELIQTVKIPPPEISLTDCANWTTFTTTTDPFCITVAPFEEGFSSNECHIVPEAIILGKRVLQTRRRGQKQKKVEIDFEIRSLAELTLGAPVVHIDYGIGRFLGLNSLTVGGQENEFVTLEYAGGDKLYVPVTSLHLISRYSGVDNEHAPIHRLGADQWQKVKRKVLEQTRDVAAELLEIYAKREAKVGFQFTNPEQAYLNFSQEFPFEETVDQHKAIQAVVADLTSTKPMDRVICGDVGFGKTEVAMRAAFIAVNNQKQVAVLVPTTLLAQQHFQTFTDRFAHFPVMIDMISRFKTKKEQETILEKLKEGKIDILIGTHKILQEDVIFKNLGLIVIDEEHRFGVRQKEAFKALRSSVDILTLTATPIPRTLNMAMSSMRDLSIIATPPARRLSIKTFVREKNTALIQEAILREIHRGGQVYYLHNEVETIENAAQELQKWVPTARIHFAHGQMRERELEQVMSDFYHHRFNVLVCTTIIETGIDIPTANTIIIDRADKFGLAQLHQLRGRVGRSHHQAYAFCLTPHTKQMSKDALKRLEALESLEELGSGFTLATHDLEIRGAGELLGEEQSGNIQSVGFSLFMELLDQAVHALKQGKLLNLDTPLQKVDIDLQIPVLIPESYLPDVHARLLLYKRIASAKTKEKLSDLKAEMVDRFGLLPTQTANLFKITELRLLAEKLGITKIEVGPQGGRLEFNEKPHINTEKLLDYIQKKSTIYSLKGPQKLYFKQEKQELLEKETRIEAVFQLLLSLFPNTPHDHHD